MRLDDIGFYTLSNERATTASDISRLSRCELVLTARCNFCCPYCRHIGGEDLSCDKAIDIVKLWADDGLRNIRFSGGEPTLYPRIFDICDLSRRLGMERIAISTNGSAKTEVYEKLIECGVNDFSVSLDACCANDCSYMSGGIMDIYDTIINNIKYLSARTYTTVGVVLTELNIAKVNDIIVLADSLRVSDIRIIPAAQNCNTLKNVNIDAEILSKYPILKYRILNMLVGKTVRGLKDTDTNRCGLVLDDMAVNQDKHYPCIIYMRESGNAIGKVSKNMRIERKEWYETHDIYNDPICRNNCLDVCIDYNRKFAETNPITQK